MKRLIALTLLIALPAFAQAPATPELSAQEQIERTIGNLVIANANLNAQLRQAQATIIDLQKKVAAAPKPAEPPKDK